MLTRSLAAMLLLLLSVPALAADKVAGAASPGNVLSVDITITVTSADRLAVRVAPGGGTAVRFVALGRK
jgi:hypothetical protein